MAAEFELEGIDPGRVALTTVNLTHIVNSRIYLCLQFIDCLTFCKKNSDARIFRLRDSHMLTSTDPFVFFILYQFSWLTGACRVPKSPQLLNSLSSLKIFGDLILWPSPRFWFWFDILSHWSFGCFCDFATRYKPQILLTKLKRVRVVFLLNFKRMYNKVSRDFKFKIKYSDLRSILQARTPVDWVREISHIFFSDEGGAYNYTPPFATPLGTCRGRLPQGLRRTAAQETEAARREKGAHFWKVWISTPSSCGILWSCQRSGVFPFNLSVFVLDMDWWNVENMVGGRFWRDRLQHLTGHWLWAISVWFLR